MTVIRELLDKTNLYRLFYRRKQIDDMLAAIELTPGPQGEPGPTGPTGPAGPAGPAAWLPTDDIFPQSSVNGLNTRFERLFGDDVPASAYSFTKRKFGITSNHIAEFEDYQGSYAFPAGSPFHINLPANCYVSSAWTSDYPAQIRHILMARTLVANPDFYLQWTSGTAKNNIYMTAAIAPYFATTDQLVAELRLYAEEAASVTANSRWWGIRWSWQPVTHPSYPSRTRFYYSSSVGDGLTFALTTGTGIGSETPLTAGAMHVFYGLATTSGGNPVGQYEILNTEGSYAGNVASVIANMPTSIKTARLYIKQQYSRVYIDRIELT